MLRFITSRLLQSLLALYIIITATFFMLRFVPGGPFTAEKAVPKEILRNLEAHYGLNQPLHRQYLDYLGSLLHGDFGPSFKYSNRTVNEILADKLPVSLELGLWSLGVALAARPAAGHHRGAAAQHLGRLSGLRRRHDRPLGADLRDRPAVRAGLRHPPRLVQRLRLVLCHPTACCPSLVLGLAYAAPISRLTRGGMLEVLNQDYIRTARAKGASETARGLQARPARRPAARGRLPRAGHRRHPHRARS